MAKQSPIFTVIKPASRHGGRDTTKTGTTRGR